MASIGLTALQTNRMAQILSSIEGFSLGDMVDYAIRLQNPLGHPDPIIEGSYTTLSFNSNKRPVKPGTSIVWDSTQTIKQWEELDADGVMWYLRASNAEDISGEAAGSPIAWSITNLGPSGLRPGTVSITRSGGGLSLTDDGAGNLTGTGGSGTVDYEAGTGTVTLDSPGGSPETMTIVGASEGGTVGHDTGTYALVVTGNAFPAVLDWVLEYEQVAYSTILVLAGPLAQVPASAEVTLTLTRADGSVFPLGTALDLRSSFVETKPLDFGDSTVSKYVDGLRAILKNAASADSLEVIVKTSNRVEGPYEEWGPYSLNVLDRVVRFRVPIAKYYIFRFQDNSVQGRWNMGEWEVFGQPSSRRFL